MIRKLLGFALLAVVVWLAVRITFGILGTLIGLAIIVLVLAGIGYAFYAVLRVFDPATAAKVREAISGKPASASR